MENDFNKEFYTLADIIKIDAKQNLRKALKLWGRKKTEKKIMRYYGNNPKAFVFMMNCYNEIINGEPDII